VKPVLHERISRESGPLCKEYIRVLAESRAGELQCCAGTFAYNLGAAISFAWMAVAATLRGFMLLPAVLLHVVVAGALLPQLLVRRRGFSDDLITVRIADSPKLVIRTVTLLEESG
jgi:hypothetical protein